VTTNVSASRQPQWTWRRDLAMLLALGLAVNALAAIIISQPGYVDAYYYFGGAKQLAHGLGFTEPYLWNYLAPRALDSASLSRWPSHLYWMPLVSILAAPFMIAAERLAGGSLSNAALFRAAQLPLILLASLLPLSSYGVAWLITGRRRHAAAAGLLTLFSAYYFVFWTTTDAFALFGLLAAGALVATGLAELQPARGLRWLFVAGLAAGLAHLTRADGLLVLACLLVWLSVSRASSNGRRRRLVAAVVVVAGYLLVMAPWYWRNWIVVGAPLAPGTGHALWLTNYDDLFAFPADRLTLPAYLAWGLRAIVSSKLSALQANLATLVAVQCGIVGFPFVLVGLWRTRDNPLSRLASFYAASLLGAMTLVFTFPGARGGYFHSGAALLPFFMPATVIGLDAAVDWAARILPHWQPEKSKPIFTGLLVGFAAALTLGLFWVRVVGNNPRRPAWDQPERVYTEVGAWLRAHGQTGALVAVNDPPGWYYFTDLPGIVIPNGDTNTLQQAMGAFGARWVVLDANRPAQLSGLYAAPLNDPNLHLRASFMDYTGQPVYLLEVGPVL
jgi:hypothetical protein